MSTAELKNLLIHRIAAINDKSFLDAIMTFIETGVEHPVYQTSEKEKQSIKKGLEQIERGEYFTNEAVEKEVDQWFTEK
jgi:predicted transcriptional regulator